MIKRLLLVCLLCVSLSFIALTDAATSSAQSKLDAIFKCILTEELPPFNTSLPFCPIANVVSMVESLTVHDENCSLLNQYISHIFKTDVSLEFIPTIFLNEANSTINDVADSCMASISEHICKYHNICQFDFTSEACKMSFILQLSTNQTGQLNFDLYTYLTAVLLESDAHSLVVSSAIPRHFLNTCMSTKNYPLDACILSFTSHCFLVDSVYFQESISCFVQVSERLCHDFTGIKEHLQCQIVLGFKLVDTLADECSSPHFEQKCNNIVTTIISKPIRSLNDYDMDQLGGVLSGNIRRANYTDQTLTRLNTIVNHFSSNETQVAGIIDKDDANIFFNVVDTLASEERVNSLNINASDASGGAMLLGDLEEMSKIVGLSVARGNQKVEHKYNFNGSNIGVFLAVGSRNASYDSGKLSLNETTASVQIPSSSVCGSSTLNYQTIANSSNDDTTSDENEYDYYDYHFPTNCTNCTNDYDYDYYLSLLGDLFGDCAQVFHIPASCPAVVVTSVANNVQPLLSSNLPANMTFGSFIITSQIVRQDHHYNSTENITNLTENATIEFELQKAMNSSAEVPMCHYWDHNRMEWSTDGVTTVIVSGNVVKCITRRLSGFAVLILHTNLNITQDELLGLTILGYVGPAISAICLLIAVVIMIVLRKQMYSGSKLYIIHLNLCISLLLGLIVLLVGLEPARGITWLCGTVAGLLHYLFLCVFAWMLIEGITMCILVTYVWGNKYLKWYIFVPFAWGIPIPIVVISAAINHESYGINSCWLPIENGTIWAFLGPVIAVSIANMFFLTVTVIQLIRVVRKKNEENKNTFEAVKSAVIGAIVLFPLLGATWIIGLFAVNQQTTVFLWLFTILNSIQGVFILIFHVLRHTAFKTCMIKKFPSLDKHFQIRTNSEAIRRMSKTSKLSLPVPKAEQYGPVKSAVLKAQIVLTGLNPIQEEDESCQTVQFEIDNDSTMIENNHVTL
jgi:hypothetical protein